MGYWDRVAQFRDYTEDRNEAERGAEHEGPLRAFDLTLHGAHVSGRSEPTYGEGPVVYENPDIPGSISTNARISVGGTVEGDLNFVGDRDWYRITLTEGQSIQVALSGTGVTPVPDTYVRIRDAAGNILAEDDDGATTGYDSLLNFIAASGGTYYIEVDSYASAEVGHYTLSVNEREPLAEFNYDQIAYQLTHDFWGGSQRAFDVGADGSLTFNITGLTAAGQFLARAALQSWTDVTGVRFVETSGVAELTFDDSDEGAYASSSFTGTRIVSSDINISTEWIASYGSTLNSYAYQTYIHEIGHALGLGHAGNYNGAASYAVDAHYLNDSWATTVMSYFSQQENSFFAQQGFDYAFITTPMNGDIVAIQALYGAPSDAQRGNSRYGFNNNTGNAAFDATVNSTTAYAIVDSAGIDTLDYNGFANAQVINLNAEVFMNVGSLVGNVIIGRGTVIENAYGGSGADHINGNAANNALRGNAGNDVMDGEGGHDAMSGGDGNDVVRGGSGNDRISGNAGTDTLSGGSGNDSLTGGGAADVLLGGGGNDNLRGSGGNDRLFGEADDDTLVGHAGHDRLEGGAGHDIIRGGTGEDTIFGDDGNDWLEGGSEIDTIEGGSGNDVINGQSFSDILTGGAGSDVFVFDSGLGIGNVDQITDFETGVDQIALDRSIFTRIASDGALAGSAFRIGTGAGDSNDRIIYNQATGELMYDANGSDAGGQFKIAQLGAGTVLKASDFAIFTDDLAGAPAAAELPNPVFADKLFGAEYVLIA